MGIRYAVEYDALASPLSIFPTVLLCQTRESPARAKRVATKRSGPCGCRRLLASTLAIYDKDRRLGPLKFDNAVQQQ